MSWTDSQINLLSTLERYEQAERLAVWFPEQGFLAESADTLHARLCAIAIACGYSPGRDHRHLSTVEWARQLSEQFRRFFPNHIKEAGL